MKITVTGKILNAEPGDLVRYGTKNCLVVRMTDEACIEDNVISRTPVDIRERGLPLQVNKCKHGSRFCKF